MFRIVFAVACGFYISDDGSAHRKLDIMFGLLIVFYIVMFILMFSTMTWQVRATQ